MLLIISLILNVIFIVFLIWLVKLPQALLEFDKKYADEICKYILDSINLFVWRKTKYSDVEFSIKTSVEEIYENILNDCKTINKPDLVRYVIMRKKIIQSVVKTSLLNHPSIEFNLNSNTLKIRKKSRTDI